MFSSPGTKITLNDFFVCADGPDVVSENGFEGWQAAYQIPGKKREDVLRLSNHPQDEAFINNMIEMVEEKLDDPGFGIIVGYDSSKYFSREFKKTTDTASFGFYNNRAFGIFVV